MTNTQKGSMHAVNKARRLAATKKEVKSKGRVPKDIHNNRQTYRQTDRQAGRHTHSHKQTSRQTDRQTDRQTNRQKHKGRQTDNTPTTNAAS